MEVLNEEYNKERRMGKFSSLDSAFLRDKLLKKSPGGKGKRSPAKEFGNNPYLEDAKRPAPASGGITGSEKKKQPQVSDEVAVQRGKLQSCFKMYAFNQADQAAARDQKAKILTELIDFLDSPSCSLLFSEEILPTIFQMLRTNVFRPFHFVPKPSSTVATIYEAEDEETLLESSWPHLQLVYQYLLRLIILPQFTSEIATKYCDSVFVKQVSLRR